MPLCEENHSSGVQRAARAMAHTERSVQTLAGIARNSTSDQARVSAAQALLDRDWGKAVQPHAGDDGNGQIQIVIRQLVDVVGKEEPVRANRA
jgi:hypothetical protein